MSLKTGAIGPAKNHKKNCILYHSTMLNRGLWQFFNTMNTTLSFFFFEAVYKNHQPGGTDIG